MEANKYQKRLLSHRLRGFSNAESSLSALQQAVLSPFKYLEIDTRHTQDGKIVVFHDSILDITAAQKGPVCKHNYANQTLTFKKVSQEKIPLLEEFLKVYVESQTQAELMIDIKDFGLEEQYRDLIDKFGIATKVHIVSWLPEVLLRMHQIAPHLRLSFSYIYLNPKSLKAKFAQLNKKAFHSQGIGKIAATLGFFLFGHKYLKLASYTVYFVNSYNKDITSLKGNPYNTGFFHIHLINGIPQGKMLEILQASRGSIGTYHLFADPYLTQQAHEKGLKVSIFSINTIKRLIPFIDKIDPDIVYTDNHKLIEQV